MSLHCSSFPPIELATTDVTLALRVRPPAQASKRTLAANLECCVEWHFAKYAIFSDLGAVSWVPFNPGSGAAPVVVDDNSAASTRPKDTVDTNLLAAVSAGVIVTAATVALAALVGVRVYYLRQMRQQKDPAASSPGARGGGGVRSPKVMPTPPPDTRVLSVEVLTPSSPVELERGDGGGVTNSDTVQQQQQQQQQQRSQASLSQASVSYPGTLASASESEDEGPAVRRLFTAPRA